MSVTVEAKFPRGTCPIHQFGSLDDRTAPIVLFFMDAFGPRQSLFDVADDLAAQGYRVLMPHLFYQNLPFRSFDPTDVFRGGDDQKRLMDMFRSLTQQMIDEDVRALLAFADERLGSEAPIGATGYCMGGRYALTAAATSARVVFAASFHGSNLAPETPDSPHQRFKGLKSRIYVGVASIDPTFGGAEEGRLAAALRDNDVDHVIETYAGAMHGFVPADLPAHSAPAAARHRARLHGHLREMFS